jgi:hypothetical protein
MHITFTTPDKLKAHLQADKSLTQVIVDSFANYDIHLIYEVMSSNKFWLSEIHTKDTPMQMIWRKTIKTENKKPGSK